MPYRIPDAAAERAARDPRRTASWDDVVLGSLLLLVAGPRVVMALGAHERFSAEPTLAAIGSLLGLLLLVAAALRGRR